MNVLPLPTSGMIGFFVVGWMASGGGPEQDDPSVATAKGPVIVEKKAEKPISVTAGDLIAAYENNEIRANKNYKDKLLDVRGYVGDVSEDILGKPFVVLNDKPDAMITSLGIQCYVRDGDVLAELDKGTEVVIRGRGDGKIMNVLLRDGSVETIFKK